MYPPEQSCLDLYRLHKNLRLAWHGREKKHADELNPGSFAIVQLYHIKDAGTYDEPRTYFTHWVGPNYYGPIFNKHGGTRRDWDFVNRVPIYVARLEDYGVSNEDVMTGKFIEWVRHNLTPIPKRIRDSHKAMGRQLDSDADAIAREAAKDLIRESHKPDAATPIKAKKHCKEEMEAWENQKKRAENLKHAYDFPGI